MVKELLKPFPNSIMKDEDLLPFSAKIGKWGILAR
jgi:hypothetical protein